MGISGRGQVWGKYGWMILFASALLGIFGGVLLMFPKNAEFLSPGIFWLTRAWGITWVGFNIFALVLCVGPYRKGERWAWYTLWLLPLLFVCYFFLEPKNSVYYLMLAVLTALGLILPYRRYIS